MHRPNVLRKGLNRTSTKCTCTRAHKPLLQAREVVNVTTRCAGCIVTLNGASTYWTLHALRKGDLTPLVSLHFISYMHFISSPPAYIYIYISKRGCRRPVCLAIESIYGGEQSTARRQSSLGNLGMISLLLLLLSLLLSFFLRGTSWCCCFDNDKISTRLCPEAATDSMHPYHVANQL